MSLADQLAHIQQSAQDAALDRKQRSSLHSVSFLYDPKYAATQDYESIYAESLDALTKLESLDRRFSRFRDTIFSDSSISVDRRTESKEQNDNLDKAINAFLGLLGPYWHLAVSVKAAEWPLRRFQMNIHNSEQMLLSSLPYFEEPVFERMLYVITKLPAMFQWLQGFKKTDKCPSRAAMTRAFTNVDFFNLYSKYISSERAHHNLYRRELVFYVSMAISALAAVSSSGSADLADFVALALESSSNLLTAQDPDAKVSAYTIMVVLSSAVPLSREVILASIDTVLLSCSGEVTSAAFRTVLKLYQNVQSDALEPLPVTTLDKLPKSMITKDSDYLNIIRSSPASNGFVTAYLRGLVAQRKPVNISGLTDIDYQFTNKELALLESDVLKQDDKSRYIQLLEYITNENKDLFLGVLAKLNLGVDDLEMSLETALPELHASDEDDVDMDDAVEDHESTSIEVDAADGAELVNEFQHSRSPVPSFLETGKVVDDGFDKLQSLYLKSMRHGNLNEFLDTCFKSEGARASFLLRLATKSQTPSRARVQALKTLNSLAESVDKSVLLSSLVPVLSTLLDSDDQKVRAITTDILETIDSKTGKDSNEIILDGVIYGPDSKDVAMLPPKDCSALCKKFLDNKQMLKLDSSAFLKVFESLVTSSKKLGPMVLASYASHANNVQIPSIKGKLLDVTSAGCRALKGSSSPAEVFKDVLKNYTEERPKWSQRCIATGSDFVQFEKSVVNLVSEKEKDDNAITFLMKAIGSRYESLSVAVQERLVVIFPTLKFEYQNRIVNDILENGLKDDSSVVYDPVDVLQSLDLDNKLFVELFKTSILGSAGPGASAGSDSSDQPPANLPKRRRRSSTTARQAMKEVEVSSLATVHLRKVTVLLDVLYDFSSKSSFNGSLELLQLLFTILDDLETLGKDGKLPILYSQEQLALCMINVIDSLKAQDVQVTDSSVLRADILVSSIRSSDSPQVQNKLLLVISSLASLSPELVLHSIMPIFTFMGAHTIRQDDEFSTHVVEETILSVVPALASTAKSGLAEEVDFLLTSFVSAFPHIPRHRRVRLFTTLARTLGSKNSVHLILFLCGQQYAEAYSKHKMANCSALSDFSSTFLQNFTSEEQLEAAKEYLDLWKEIPEDVIEKDSKVYSQLTSRVIFGPSIVAMNKSELYNLRKGLISFLRHSLVDSKSSAGVPKLRLKVASELIQNEGVSDLNTFSSLIESILSLIDEYSNSFEDEEILKKLYKLLGDVMSLLPIDYYVNAISSILESPKTSSRTKKQVTTLSAIKFGLERNDSPAAIKALDILFPILLGNISAKTDVELSQASFDTLATFFQRFNENLNPQLLKDSMSVAVSDAGLKSENSPELIVSSISCITSLVTVAGVKMIGFFPQIIAPLDNIFAQTLEGNDESLKLIQTSVLVLISALVRKIPNFVTPNVKDFMRDVFNARLVPEAIRNSVLSSIANYVDPKISLQALCSLWPEVSQLDSTTIGLLLSTLEMVIERLDKKSAVSQASTFTRFFLQALEFKSGCKFDVNTANRIEATIIKCGIQYVMKLNDKTFRPLFASIVRWTFDGEGVTNTAIPDTDRMQSFFKFFNKLQDNLRGIVTSYYSYLFDNTISLLDRFSSGDLENIPLRRLVMISLGSSFKYDQVEYWQTNTRFDPVSKALTNQLVNIEDSIGKHLVKTISSLVQSTSSDDHNKHVNEQLMSHMRADCKPREKYWTVRTLKSIYKKVGENWLALLPQLVPLIAELLEDDDEEVEMEVRTGLAKVIEQVMGEPLDKYLE